MLAYIQIAVSFHCNYHFLFIITYYLIIVMISSRFTLWTSRSGMLYSLPCVEVWLGHLNILARYTFSIICLAILLLELPDNFASPGSSCHSINLFELWGFKTVFWQLTTLIAIIFHLLITCDSSSRLLCLSYVHLSLLPLPLNRFEHLAC